MEGNKQKEVYKDLVPDNEYLSRGCCCLEVLLLFEILDE